MDNREQSETLMAVASQFSEERDYWLRTLSGDFEKIGFPYTNKRSASGDAPAKVKFELPQSLSSRLMKIGRGSDARLHIILVSAVIILLDKYNHQHIEDIIVGVPIYRQEAAGRLVNTVLALRNHLDQVMTVKELILQVHQVLKEAVKNQNYPIEALLYQLGLPSDQEEFPLFDLAVLLENIHSKEYLDHININMLFSFLRSGESIAGVVEYNPSKYDREDVERVGCHLICLLQDTVFDLDTKISQIELVSQEEKNRLLVGFNDTYGSVGYPQDKTLHRLFEEQAKRAPGRTALIGNRQSAVGKKEKMHVAYALLNDKADRLAGVLKEKGVYADNIVGIMLERYIEMIVGILAILKAGGAYMPIDPDYPEERIDYMLTDSAAEVLLTTGALMEQSEKLKSRHGETIFVDELKQGRHAGSPRQPGSNSLPPAAAGSLAYVIYTSGTTGKPKGALLQHRNVVQLMFHDNYLFDFDNNDVWTMFHSFCFDFSVWEMYGALLYGGKLVLVAKMTARDPQQFLEILRDEQVTILNQTPPAFYNLANQELATSGKKLNLKYIIFGGEALAPAKLKQWKEKYPAAKLINMFGITETTVHVTYKEITDRDIELNTCEIGQPIPTLNVDIMDKNLKLLPRGVSGELCVGGEGICRGYLNRPELTDEKFVGNPHKIGEKLYRSGDLGRYSGNGELECLGRIDFQVKIRGFRVELGEIESQLLKHERIKESAAAAKKDKDGNGFLCAYIVAEGEVDVPGLKKYLAVHLPDYMVPLYIVQIEKIPLTPNGKVNRKALPEPGIETGEEYIAPRNETEEILAQIWSEELILKRVGIKDIFFQVGGDSIKAIKLLTAINRAFQSNFKIVDLFINDTIEKLAGVINREKDARHDEALTAVRNQIEASKNRILADNRLSGADIEDIYPMSDIEKGMVFHSLKEPERALYHDQMVHQVRYADFDPSRFKRALALMVEKHPMLRTGFHIGDFGEPVQIVHKTCPIDMEHYDISHMERGEQEEYLREIIAADRQNPFDVARAPLWRMRTFALNNDHIVILWVFHHAILDGWSDASFKTELNNIYIRLKAEPGFHPGLLKNSYKEFIVEQWALKKEDRLLDYWRDELADYKRLESWGPAEKPKAPAIIKSYSYELGRPLWEQLHQVAGHYHTSLKHLCFGAYIYMLNMLSYENDITAGLVTNNRPLCEDGEKILGCFLNTVPVRVSIPGNIKWSDYIRLIEEKMVKLAGYNRLSLFEILRLTGEEYSHQNPIFDTLFNFVDFHIYKDANMGDENEKEDIVNRVPTAAVSVSGQVATNTLFDFSINATSGGFLAHVSYSLSLLSEEMFLQLFHYFKSVLNKFIHEPGEIATKDRLMGEEEKRKLLVDFNDTASAHPGDRTIHRLFEEQVERKPDRIAAVGNMQRAPGKAQVTYGELNRQSDRFVHLSREKGIQPDTHPIVGIMGERFIETIIGILGILKAGGAYLPIDPDYPQERVEYMLADSGAKALVGADSGFDGIPVGSQDLHRGVPSSALNNRPAYIIYTSGTTGKPKGVMVGHRSLVNLCFWHNRCFQVTANDTAAQYASFGFDASVWEVFPYLIMGASVHIIGDELKLDLLQLNEYYEKNSITIGFLPTQLCEQFMFMEQGNHSLRILLTGGDKLRLFQEKAYDIYNNYGPTENTVVNTSFLVDKYYENIPIGKPIANNRIYILSKNNHHLQPVGVPGELFISGESLACGYLNQPELTWERFIESPLTPHPSPFIRLYRTGDLARWLPDGNIEFLARIDNQVKIRGYRIELGEIENQLLKHEEIKEAVVLDRPMKDGNRCLCAYIIARRNIEDRTRVFREYLSKMLPAYMIPSYFIFMDSFPLTHNGKIDRRELPLPGIEREDAAGSYTAPRNEVEEKLVEIWSEVLQVDKDAIGIDADFFHLGGHSIKVTIMITRIHKVFHVKVPLAKVFETPTIRGLAESIITTESAGDRCRSIEPAEEKEYYAVSSAQKRLYILRMMEGEDSINYNISNILLIQGELDRIKMEESFQKLIGRHESLRTSFCLVEENPVQIIHPMADIRFKMGYDRCEEEQAKERVKQFIEPFDLAKAPIFKASLLKIAKDRYILMVALHHIAADGTSMQVMIEEFYTLYRGKELAGLRLQYKDYSEWQNKQLYSGEVTRQEAYWLNLFKDEIPPLNVPTDFPRPSVRSTIGSIVEFQMDSTLTIKIKQLAAKTGTTLYMTLLAAFTILLSKYSRQEENIVVGTPVSGRNHADLLRLIGTFANMLAMKNSPHRDKRFNEFLAEVKENCLRAYENQDYQFEQLVNKLGQQTHAGRNPLFDVVFNMINIDAAANDDNPAKNDKPALADQLIFAPYEYEYTSSLYDLLLRGMETSETIQMSLEYCTALFKRSTVEKMTEHYVEILNRVVENEDIKIKEITVSHGLMKGRSRHEEENVDFNF